jgi:hypothetical protein
MVRRYEPFRVIEVIEVIDSTRRFGVSLCARAKPG